METKGYVREKLYHQYENEELVTYRYTVRHDRYGTEIDRTRPQKVEFVNIH